MDTSNILIQRILDLLDDPTTLGEALRCAGQLSLNRDNLFLFKQLKQEFIAGIHEIEMLKWIDRLRTLVSSCIADNKNEKTENGNYKDDPDKKWCHLDHKKIKHKFDVLRWKEHKLNVIMIEHDRLAFSNKIPEILHVHYCRQDTQQQNPANLKGDYLLDYIYFDSMEIMRSGWVDFMNFHFKLNENLSGIYDQFKRKRNQTEIYFVVHSVEKYNALLIGEYLKLWESLGLETPLYLFIHLKIKVRPKVSLPDNCICLYTDEYENISPDDLGDFCDHYDDCYSYDPGLLAGLSVMSYRDAVEKLKFCQK